MSAGISASRPTYFFAGAIRARVVCRRVSPVSAKREECQVDRAYPASNAGFCDGGERRDRCPRSAIDRPTSWPRAASRRPGYYIYRSAGPVTVCWRRPQLAARRHYCHAERGGQRGPGCGLPRQGQGNLPVHGSRSEHRGQARCHRHGSRTPSLRANQGRRRSIPTPILPPPGLIATPSTSDISHFHGDHVNGLLTADNKPAFPNAEILGRQPNGRSGSTTPT